MNMGSFFGLNVACVLALFLEVLCVGLVILPIYVYSLPDGLLSSLLPDTFVTPRSRVSTAYHNRCFASSNIHSAPVGSSFVNVDRGISVAPLFENQECSRDAMVMCRDADENQSSSFKSCSSSKRLHDSMAICDNIDGNEGSSSKRR
nr:hypothetical protein [Tanacetum cinerariifolium]